MMHHHAKYDPLAAYLKSVGVERIRMTFDEIEQVIGASLPNSARKHRAWWSNSPSNSVITYAWLSAGYKTKDVNMEREFLTFRKDASVAPKPLSAPKTKTTDIHPVLGCMSGTVVTSSDTDLTKPGLPEWEAITAAQGIHHE